MQKASAGAFDRVSAIDGPNEGIIDESPYAEGRSAIIVILSAGHACCSWLTGRHPAPHT